MLRETSAYRTRAPMQDEGFSREVATSVTVDCDIPATARFLCNPYSRLLSSSSSLNRSVSTHRIVASAATRRIAENLLRLMTLDPQPTLLLRIKCPSKNKTRRRLSRRRFPQTYLTRRLRQRRSAELTHEELQLTPHHRDLFR